MLRSPNGIQQDHRGKLYRTVQVQCRLTGQLRSVHIDVQPQDAPPARTIPVPKEPERGAGRKEKVITTGVDVKRKVISLPKREHHVAFRVRGHDKVHCISLGTQWVYDMLIDALRSHEHPVKFYAYERLGAADWFQQWHQNEDQSFTKPMQTQPYLMVEE